MNRNVSLLAVTLGMSLSLAAEPVAAEPGTEFWAVLSASPSRSYSLTVVIGNPHATEAADILVETESGPLVSASVPPRGTYQLTLGTGRTASDSVRATLAYRVTSTRPVHAYQMTPFSMVMGTGSGSILLDRARFGLEYLVVTGPMIDLDQWPSVITIVSPQAARVEIVPAADVVAGSGVPALAKGVPATFNLVAFEVLQFVGATLGDLTGTQIRSDRPIEVFAGCHDCHIGPSGADAVQETMLPVRDWGKTVLAVNSGAQTWDTNLWRILGSVDGTTVTTDPPQPGTPAVLNRGKFLEVAVNADFLVSATAPVLVARINQRGIRPPSEGMSDPAMCLMLSPERFGRGGFFELTNEFMLPINWVDIVAVPGTVVTVDGTPVPAGDFVPIGGSGYSHAQVVLSNATVSHSVESDGPVGIYAGSSCCAITTTIPVDIGYPPNLAPICDAGGPYTASCQGPVSRLRLSGVGSSDPEAQPLTYSWSSVSTSVAFDDAVRVDHEITVPGLGMFTIDLQVSDGFIATSCSTAVTLTGSATIPPELDRFTTPLWLARRGADILFSWQDLGGSEVVYNVYEGSLDTYWSHVPLRCGEAGSPIAGGRREAIFPPGSGSRYFQVSASNCFAEGPSGADPALSTCAP